jgi:hypothetical protein
VQAEGFTLFAGSTSWEGEGFIALEQSSTGHLLWLLHLSESEKFTEVFINGSTIHAISDEYPSRFEWSIPIHSPEELSVIQLHDA